MLFLALQQDTGIGALSYVSDVDLPQPAPEKLDDLLKWDHKESAFEYLLNKYLLQTTISGVQPKVLIKFGRELKTINPARVLDEFADVINDQLGNQTLFSEFPELHKSISSALTRSGARNNVFLKTDVKRPKKRKTDSLL